MIFELNNGGRVLNKHSAEQPGCEERQTFYGYLAKK